MTVISQDSNILEHLNLLAALAEIIIIRNFQKLLL